MSAVDTLRDNTLYTALRDKDAEIVRLEDLLLKRRDVKMERCDECHRLFPIVDMAEYGEEGSDDARLYLCGPCDHKGVKTHGMGDSAITSNRDEFPRPTGPGKHPFSDYEPVTEYTKRARMVPEREFANWAGCLDPHEVLKPGVVYNVVGYEERSWHTRAYLEGIDGYFNNLDLEAVE